MAPTTTDNQHTRRRTRGERSGKQHKKAVQTQSYYYRTNSFQFIQFIVFSSLSLHNNITPVAIASHRPSSIILSIGCPCLALDWVKRIASRQPPPPRTTPEIEGGLLLLLRIYHYHHIIIISSSSTPTLHLPHQHQHQHQHWI